MQNFDNAQFRRTSANEWDSALTSMHGGYDSVMSARRVAATVALAALASLLAVNAARADGPAISTPGTPTVVANEPHQLTLSWAPSTWVEPGTEQPINYEVQVPLGPNTYRFLGSTTDTTITLTDLAPGTTYRIAVAAARSAATPTPRPPPQCAPRPVARRSATSTWTGPPRTTRSSTS